MREEQTCHQPADVSGHSPGRAAEQQKLSAASSQPAASPWTSSAGPAAELGEREADDAADWSFAAWGASPAQHLPTMGAGSEAPVAKRSRPGPATVFRWKQSGVVVT